MNKRLGRIAVLGAAIALVVPALASANEVTKWNEITVSTVNGQPGIASAPPAGSIFIAMSQGAVYGAVNAIDRHGRSYLVKRSFPMASKDAAAATAAFRVLDTLFPGSHGALQAEYDISLALIPDGPLKMTGIQVGRMAADAMLAEGHDGRTVIGCTFGSGAPGEWTPLPDSNGNPLCDPSPWVKNAVPFLVRSRTQFRTPGPHALTSAAYTADFNEVKSVGALNSNTRTPAQSHAAAFWQTNPGGNFNAIGRRFVNTLGLDMSDSARLFAMMDLSAADALITTWSDKYARNFWRPITAIRRADIDGNPDTVADPNWKPMFDPTLDPTIGGTGPPLITPPYPDHPSGATAYASASMNALASFFGTDEMSFFATSSRFPGEQRPFSRFSDVTNEVLLARIWAGIHFRNPDAQSAELGREVERYIHTHYFAANH
jgi:VCPO second helical-bundle domain